MGKGQQAAVLIGALVLLAALGLGGVPGSCSRGSSASQGADAGQFERVQDVERLLQGTWCFCQAIDEHSGMHELNTLAAMP